MPSTAYTDRYDLFRELLRELRESKGVTQAQLAERLEIPQSYVSKYETGERRLDFVETAEICEALGIKTADLANLFESRLRKAAATSKAHNPRRRKP
ncbi:MAG: helix-turn-helix transcriptional regulator [Verrucomicrobia bacterium]|nr:helix-turn-helix transcriptional regulator [Verrucomicrobiota bacterium]